MTATTVTAVVGHQTPDKLDLFKRLYGPGREYRLPAGTPLGMVDMGHGVTVWIAADGGPAGIITDIREGVPAGYRCVNVLTTLALWVPENVS